MIVIRVQRNSFYLRAKLQCPNTALEWVASHRWRTINHEMRLGGLSEGRKKKEHAQGTLAMLLGNKLPMEAKVWCNWKESPIIELDIRIMTQ